MHDHNGLQNLSGWGDLHSRSLHPKCSALLLGYTPQLLFLPILPTKGHRLSSSTERRGFAPHAPKGTDGLAGRTGIACPVYVPVV